MESGLLKSIPSKNRDDKEEVDESFDMSVITREDFWSAIRVYIDKPHVVNKRVCGFEPLWIGTTTGHLNTADLLVKVTGVLNLKDVLNQENLLEVLKNLFIDFEFSDSISWGDVLSSGVHFACIRRILPKQLLKPLFEVILIDGELNIVSFTSEAMNGELKYIPDAPYKIFYLNNAISIEIQPGSIIDASSEKWLKEVLLSRLNKWSYQAENTRSTEPSLKCVNIQQYNQVYQRLKSKYGKVLVEMWNESTDPLKFVYEDIAIASYLIVLWEEESVAKLLTEKQSFVDIGCGNGLLVYLLSSEGYKGCGIDLKRRKIWDTFPDYVVLKEESFKPSDEYLFPQYDWLIGNHSDELTPWLPVIAAKSSMNTRYFVIPCCAHDFQSKFLRMKSGVSQYAEYLDYVEKIGKMCGFDVLRDKLRIPSTKRICFIGQLRTYTSDKYNGVMESIDKFVKERCGSLGKNEVGDCKEWSDGFKVRVVDERVRNCTQIKDEIKEELIKIVTSLLLKEENMIDIYNDLEKFKWNKGVKVEILTIANTLTKKQRSFLKNECGGLQTLLRNHRFVFVVQGGSVSFRVPQKASDKSVPSTKQKLKSCWFFYNHPQGCTLTSDECTFIH